MTRTALGFFAIAAVACGPRPVADGPANRGGAGGEITLYRDRAVVRQRVEIDVPVAAYARVRVRVPAGIAIDDLYVLERDRFTIAELRMAGDPRPELPDELSAPEPTPEDADEPTPEDADELAVPDELEAVPEPPAEPREVELVIGAPRAGRFAIHLGYSTDRLRWGAAYTMTTTATRDHAVLGGAIAVRNTTGIALPAMELRVVDAELAAWTEDAALVDPSDPAATPNATPRALGRVVLGDGETRIELLPDAVPREMRSVLVYDPIGTALDRPGSAPVRERSFGAGPASSRVTESFEIVRDRRATAGLPAGPVRLLERRGDGTLAVLGEARLFDASTRVARVDTIPVGTAEGVTGRRERREYTDDERGRRVVEEFVLTIESTRPRPVEVVLREHLYRGHQWALAYPLDGRAVKEGPQQLSMRTIVPSGGRTKTLYVVVYTW